MREEGKYIRVNTFSFGVKQVGMFANRMNKPSSQCHC